MLKKLLFAILLIANFSAYSQFTNSIVSSQLPASGGMILDVVDFNNDGFEDVVYQSGLSGAIELYKNTNGVFSNYSLTSLLPAITGSGTGNEGVLSFDYNNDGFQDLLISRAGAVGGYMRLFKNNCGVNFTEVTSAVNLPIAPNLISQYISNGPILMVMDYDKDNDNDLVYSRINGVGVFEISALKNTAGVFSNPIPLITGFGSTITPNFAIIDFDNDRDEDLIIIKNTANGNSCQIDLYGNNGVGIYTLETAATGLSNSSPVGFANVYDINNDGFNDVVLGTKDVVGGGPGNLGLKAFFNLGGTGSFSVNNSFNTQSLVGDYFKSHTIDIDNDGNLDLLWEVNSSTPNSTPLLNRKIGTGLIYSNVTNTTIPTAITTSGAPVNYVVFDFNNDGFMDIFVPGTTASSAKLLKNPNTANKYINLKLVSCNGQAEPIGARVFVKAGSTRQIKTYNGMGMSSTGTGKSEQLHFGVGNNVTIDSIVVFWPNGNINILTNESANKNLTIYDGSCKLGNTTNFNFLRDTINFCNQTTGTIFADTGFVSYSWLSGETTPDITVTASKYYYCTATNADGCFATDSIFVMFGKGFILQTDTTMCLGATMRLDAYPRYDCSPLGAPVKRKVNAGDIIDPRVKYVNSLNGHHYYRFLSSSTWTSAETIALSLGGHLAVINDQIENDFLLNETDLDNKNLWLGLYRKGGVGTAFQWVNCDSLKYTNWSSATNSPTNGLNDKHVYFRNVNNCSDTGFWKNTNENSLPLDPCESSIFGLIEFDASTNVSYLWNNGDTTATSFVTPLTTKIHSVKISQNGSSCSGSINIEIRDPNNLLPTGINDIMTACKASSMKLQATPGMTSYLWSTGDTNSFISINSAGGNRWYSVTVVTPEGCTGKDSVYVILYNSTIRTPDTTVCLGAQVFLRGPTPAYVYQTDYVQNFQTTPFASWNSASSITFNGSKNLGPFGNDSVTYNMIDLPAHDSIRVTFDLFIHDTWEGNCAVVGSDKFRFKNGNKDELNTTFSNTLSCSQNYTNIGDSAFTGATQKNLPLRCDINGVTTKYTITRAFSHSSANLDLSWVAELTDTVDNSTLCNESWTLDNVSIEVRRGGNVLWSTGDTTQNIFVTPVDPITEYWVQVPVGNTFCYDTVFVTTTTGKLPNDIFTQDTLRYCNAAGTPVTLNLPLNFDRYTWSNGDLNRVTQVYNEGWYSGYVETLTGCYNYDSVYVAMGGIKIVPNTDTTVCYGSPIAIKAYLNNDCSMFGPPVNTGYVAGQVIPGYTWKGEYRGKNYYLADINSTWSGAAQSALAAGGHLACINDTNEQNYIAAMVDSNAWLGAYKGPNGYFIWMNCDTITYTNWASSEPSASPDDYMFMRSANCAEPKKWDANQDNDQGNPDACLNNIYGLLEIAPYQYTFDWWIDGVSTYYTDSIVIMPTAPTRVFGLVRKSPGAGNCFIGSINIDLIDEGFRIIKDSITKISCDGDTVMIEALPGFANYNWDNGETSRIAVYSNKIGWAYCTYDNGTCIFIDSIYLNVPGKLTTTPTITDITCFGANDGIGIAAYINGTPPFNVQWIHNGSTNPIETNLAPGVYYYTVTDSNNCFAMDSITITNPATPLTLSFTELIGIKCFNDTTAIIIPIPLGGASPYSGNWIGFVAPDTLFYKGAGIYTYTVTDTRGCTITLDDTLTQPTELDITANITKQIFCPEDSNGVVILGASGGISPYNFVWNLAPVFGDTLKKVYNGLTYAYVVDANFCYDSVAIVMLASNPEKCGVVVPNGFTPNGDGVNDLFYIRGLGDYPDNELTIFNRWGETVYQSTNYKNDWNGKPAKSTLLGGNDGIVPNDTYFWILTTKANNKTISGYVYITK
ncbi:MAG: gliding motility-associated C-terminal domain-containing protein [bacterium]|nr:gliding motility-associated C-terminal domain-containing protein [bacterium]